jgi:hypothetical protein
VLRSNDHQDHIPQCGSLDAFCVTSYVASGLRLQGRRINRGDAWRAVTRRPTLKMTCGRG